MMADTKKPARWPDAAEQEIVENLLSAGESVRARLASHATLTEETASAAICESIVLVGVALVQAITDAAWRVGNEIQNHAQMTRPG